MHDAILETILCGMNEVDSSNIKQEIKKLSEIPAGGMTGFQEKFKVRTPVDMLCCFFQFLRCILRTKQRDSFFFYVFFLIQRLGDISPKFSVEECSAGLLEENETKNRSKSIYPG